MLHPLDLPSVRSWVYCEIIRYLRISFCCILYISFGVPYIILQHNINIYILRLEVYRFVWMVLLIMFYVPTTYFQVCLCVDHIKRT